MMHGEMRVRPSSATRHRSSKELSIRLPTAAQPHTLHWRSSTGDSAPRPKVIQAWEFSGDPRAAQIAQLNAKMPMCGGGPVITSYGKSAHTGHSGAEGTRQNAQGGFRGDAQGGYGGASRPLSGAAQRPSSAAMPRQSQHPPYRSTGYASRQPPPSGFSSAGPSSKPGPAGYYAHHSSAAALAAAALAATASGASVASTARFGVSA
ncbi:hypothetical protein T492DRAFT_878581 [Pavlovales sp. CCMP2436]|nr:hypothetical protein T492DRAFT_878581 [Pavlovales sp. CCMP2436]